MQAALVSPETVPWLGWVKAKVNSQVSASLPDRLTVAAVSSLVVFDVAFAVGVEFGGVIVMVDRVA